MECWCSPFTQLAPYACILHTIWKNTKQHTTKIKWFFVLQQFFKFIRTQQPRRNQEEKFQFNHRMFDKNRYTTQHLDQMNVDIVIQVWLFWFWFCKRANTLIIVMWVWNTRHDWNFLIDMQKCVIENENIKKFQLIGIPWNRWAQKNTIFWRNTYYYLLYYQHPHRYTWYLNTKYRKFLKVLELLNCGQWSWGFSGIQYSEWENQTD